ncbi:reverse partial [Lasallia pustulata]|uniref:Reverse partial n=1 Tax=Lasallia pustulata TaxID=136370 RepID=A0A1W5D062_9LECA|nr:reverse partial [Lasallia pustulata]
MDFILGLPETEEGFDVALSVTDKCSKRVTLLPGKNTYKAEDWATVLLEGLTDWGIPGAIITDRDPKVMSEFWKELATKLKIEMLTSTAYHPQTDGQSERTNQTAEIALRYFLTSSPKSNWAKYLPRLRSELNKQRNASTGKSPDEVERLVIRKEAEDAANFANLLAKLQYDKHHRLLSMEVGDEVFIKLHKGYTLPSVTNRKLSNQRAGPLKIVKKIGLLAYRLDIPVNWKIHPVISVAQLEPAPKGSDPYEREDRPSNPPAVEEFNSEWHDYEVEKLVGRRDRKLGKGKKITEYLQPPSWSVAAHNINIESPTRAITIATNTITITIDVANISAMSVFTAVNIPCVSDFSSAAAAGNSGDPPPPGKPVGPRAQCDKEGSGSGSTGEFVVVAITARKRKGNGVGKQPVRHSKRARRPPLGDASDGDNSCPEWCRSNDNLPARMQQARRRGRAIWAQPICTLLGGSRCGACVRAGADKCFVAQTLVCARCTSLRNPREQCLAEPPASATPDSGSPGVVAPRAATYGGSGGMGTRSRPSTRPSPPCPLPATTGTIREPRSRSSTPEELVATMAVLPESTAHALRILNAHQSCRRHENIEFNERRRIEEMGSEASSDGEDGSGTAGEE